MPRRLGILSFFFLTFILSAHSQTNSFVVKSISLDGNNRTKDRIIYRELDIQVGDTIASNNLGLLFSKNRNRILDTGLFIQASINVKNWDLEAQTADIEIRVNENWYLFAYPIFELADRNFNVWWNEYNRSLSRVNYGARATHYNITGRKDRFKIITQLGYTRKFELEYQNPYFNKAQTWGYGLNMFYADNKEIQVSSFENKQVFFRNDAENIMLQRWRLRAQLEYRPDLFWFHELKMEWHKQEIHEDAFATVPDYFSNNKDKRQFLSLSFSSKWDKRIFRLYPEGGYFISTNFRKDGLGIYKDEDDFVAGLQLEKYWKIRDKLIIATSINYQTHLFNDDISFRNYRALGYNENVMHGYELYVVDGESFYIQKHAIRYPIINRLLNIKGSPLKTLRKMPLRIYLALNYDFGRVNDSRSNQENPFSNRWIHGGGIGLDFILYNTFLIKVEYSLNDKKEGGVFLRTKLSF